MPIRPIDVISMPNRSQEASQVHQTENQKLTNAHEKLGMQYNASLQHDAKQTVKTNKSENHEYRYKDGKKKNNEKNAKQQDNNDKDSKEEKKDIKLSGFDMFI
ncbi:MAG: hypothetical protein RSB37_08410 [Acetivibrio sp.]